MRFRMKGRRDENTKSKWLVKIITLHIKYTT
jgi:hypothetical protein